MAKNTGNGSRRGAVTGRTQMKSSNGTWIKRNSASGRFMDAKAGGGAFKGVVKERKPPQG